MKTCFHIAKCSLSYAKIAFLLQLNCIIPIKSLHLHVKRDTYCMRLILMTKSTFFVEEDKIITTLFEEGLTNLHLFKPGAEPIYSERLLTLLPEEYYGKITVHDFFYLKEEYRLKGIHIDNPTKEPPLQYKGHISRTCRSLDELKDMKKKSDYVFLKNVFSTPSALPSFSQEELKSAHKRGLIDKKVYALGGVSLDNIKMAKDMGFGGVVICDDLWDRFDIHHEQDYKDLILHFEKLRKAAS